MKRFDALASRGVEHESFGDCLQAWDVWPDHKRVRGTEGHRQGAPALEENCWEGVRELNGKGGIMYCISRECHLLILPMEEMERVEKVTVSVTGPSRVRTNVSEVWVQAQLKIWIGYTWKWQVAELLESFVLCSLLVTYQDMQWTNTIPSF